LALRVTPAGEALVQASSGACCQRWWWGKNRWCIRCS